MYMMKWGIVRLIFFDIKGSSALSKFNPQTYTKIEWLDKGPGPWTPHLSVSTVLPSCCAVASSHGSQHSTRIYHTSLSCPICVPDNSWLHSDISNCHTHYTTFITISIISETIPNIILGVINIIAITSETSNTGHGLPLSELLLETYRCAQTHFLHT